ncbi:cardiolipin synthase [Sphingobacterium alkalisoli]|uniref:Cardiolipin synthase n=1 Tax=Sphingobacterium alkalisoli TaxID=1874115 RepID=A0A4U0GU03_9SPHI|nr:cardiolipin synthase [Sphingobacterium alkalisoli]TJY62463.1 cardiolipin synthase [Sphingobacterium alkalisoli]GGH29351.1 cardiolipin synthase [Sphingobacterium alkalisoli]
MQKIVLSEKIQELFHILQEWYWLPVLFLYVGVISTILIENRNPSKTMAWVLVIVFLPVVGLLLYYFFGQKFSKVKKMRRINQRQAVRLKKEWKRLDPIMEELIHDIRDDIGDLSRVFTFLKNERLSSPTINNAVTLLINGEEKFKYFIEALNTAKHSIHLEYYIFELDNIGLQILNILERKASEGVEVRLVVDSFGSPAFVRYMKRVKSGIQFKAFLPVTFSSLANSNYRNHRKIAVIDGEVGFIGGINISDRYINDPKNNNSVYWRDTSIRIEGMAINMLQVGFWHSWNQADGEPFMLEKGYLKELKQYHDCKENAAVAFVSSDPASKGPFNMEAILIALGEANTKIQLCTPYYIPSDELATVLMIAASSGVEVELMIPAKSDSYLVRHASFSFLKPLLERGVKVYLYNKGFMHAKTITVDGKLAFVGTVNLDIRSFYINYEVAAAVSDQNLCIQMERQFEIDKLECNLLTLEVWQSRSKWKRGVDSICRLLAPVL